MERTELTELLRQTLPRTDWETEARLVDDGVLSSLDILTVLTALSAEKRIRIPGNEMKAQNFNSVDAILALCNRYR
ncbi:MAG: acyl carrier protein [Clostridia bacterium]|nr:acyl carrier protein [Clostridia bacterium]